LDFSSFVNENLVQHSTYLISNSIHIEKMIGIVAKNEWSSIYLRKYAYTLIFYILYNIHAFCHESKPTDYNYLLR
jgi:hypothetical protein